MWAHNCENIFICVSHIGWLGGCTEEGYLILFSGCFGRWDVLLSGTRQVIILVDIKVFKHNKSRPGLIHLSSMFILIHSLLKVLSSKASISVYLILFRLHLSRILFNQTIHSSSAVSPSAPMMPLSPLLSLSVAYRLAHKISLYATISETMPPFAYFQPSLRHSTSDRTMFRCSCLYK